MTGQLTVACRGGFPASSTRVMTGTGLRVIVDDLGGAWAADDEEEEGAQPASSACGLRAPSDSIFALRLSEADGLRRAASHDWERAWVRCGLLPGRRPSELVVPQTRAGTSAEQGALGRWLDHRRSRFVTIVTRSTARRKTRRARRAEAARVRGSTAESARRDASDTR